MKIKDFIAMVRPISMCDPEADISFVKVHEDSPQTIMITPSSVTVYLKVE